VTVDIRDARPDDAAELAELLGQLGYPGEVDAVGRRLERLGASDADRLLVAEADGRIVGLAGVHVCHSLEYDRDAAKLSALVVDEERRGTGVGRALVAAAEAEARARGCELLFLTTAERRTGAHAFYRALGFEETGRRFAKQLVGD
jgi:N-acetylglutamate synthase-like GNAT family acetyltransferase